MLIDAIIYLISCQSIDPDANASVLMRTIDVDGIRNTKWIDQCSILDIERMVVVMAAAAQIPPQQAHWKISISWAVHPFCW